MEEPTWSRSTQCVPYIYYYARYMHTRTYVLGKELEIDHACMHQ
jgi:hypothetical protein